MHRPSSPASALARVALVLAGLLVAAAPASAEEVTRELALETFDDVWGTIQREHFDPEYNGVDWDAVREELRPKAAGCTEMEALRDVLRDMLGRLGQSHFVLVPKEELPQEKRAEVPEEREGGCGIELRRLDGRFVVCRVLPETPARERGVRPGWILDAVDGESCEEVFESVRAPSEKQREVQGWRKVRDRVLGPVGSVVVLGFLDGDDEPVEIRLERSRREVVPYNLRGGGLPTFYLRFEREVVRRDGLTVGVVRFSNWFQPLLREIKRAVEDFRDCDAIVFDLRGNTGGDGSLVAHVAGLFFTGRRELGRQRMRRGTMVYEARPARGREPFLGPFAILTDRLTGSTSEVFTGGIQSVGRAKVIGETTPGAALPARTRILPNGDSLIHAIGDFVTADGTLLEGRGVIPDVAVPLTRESLLSGEDRALDAALEWVAAGRQAAPSGGR